MREPGSETRIWWGEINQPLEEARFDGLRGKVTDYLAAQRRSTSSTPSPVPTRSTGSGCASSPASPYHALFAKTMFIRPTDEELEEHEPQALVLHAPEVEADPERGRDEDGNVRRAPPLAHRGA